ncbi:hypothetical protein [Streptomyces sp. ODS28]|uniref:hypothetical protein n=1 Tax=Streptomyces sp. ODS28 TaxID=3136688 RepID=UPI0031EE298A
MGQQGGGASQAVDGADAATALRGAEEAERRARLQARLVPEWYGPVAAVLLAVYSIGTALIRDAGIGLLWPVTGPLVILLALGLGRAARRRTGVVARPTPARQWAVFGVTAAVFAAVYAVCWLAGLGTSASLAVTGTALGLAAWAYFARRNATIRRELRGAA